MRQIARLIMVTSATLLSACAAGHAQIISPTTTVPSTHTPSHDNYAGWDSEWTDPDVGDSITTTWQAVPMDCSAGWGEASPWPGMGDTQTTTGTAPETNLAQLGYDMDCTKSGKMTYTAWTECIHNGHDPGEVDYPKDRIHVDDALTATLTWEGRGRIDTTMTDQTAGWTIHRAMRFAKTYVPAGVEDIMEATSGLPMVDFSPVTFTTTVVYHGVAEDYADAPDLHSYDSRHATTSNLVGPSWTSTFAHR